MAAEAIIVLNALFVGIFRALFRQHQNGSSTLGSSDLRFTREVVACPGTKPPTLLKPTAASLVVARSAAGVPTHVMPPSSLRFPPPVWPPTCHPCACGV